MKPRFYSISRLAARLAISGTIALALSPFAGQVATQTLESRLSASPSRQFIPSQEVFFGKPVESIEAVVENPQSVACSKGFALVNAAISGTPLAYDVFLAVSGEPNPEINAFTMRPIWDVEYFSSDYGQGRGIFFLIGPGALKQGEYFVTVFAKRKVSRGEGLMMASAPLTIKSCQTDKPAEVLMGNGYVLEKKSDGIELVASDDSSRNKVQIAYISVHAGNRQVYVNRVLFVNSLLIDRSYYQSFLIPYKTIEVVVGNTRLLANL